MTHRVNLLSVALMLLGIPLASASAAPPQAGPATSQPAPDTGGDDAPAGTAAAEPADEARQGEGLVYERGGLLGSGLVVGLQLGGGFSGVFSELGAAFVPELSVGVTLPTLERVLAIFVSGQWAAPEAEGSTAPDPRLPGDGVMNWGVTQQQLALTLGLRLRVPIPSELFRPNVAVGARLYLLRTEVSGSAGGEPFGDHEETATEAGIFASAGGEFFVGPGALSLEVQVGWSELDGYVMQNTNTGSLNLMAGYRLFL